MKVFILTEEIHGFLGVFSTLQSAVEYAKAWSHETTCGVWGNPETDDEIEVSTGEPADPDDWASSGAYFIVRPCELDPTAPE